MRAKRQRHLQKQHLRDRDISDRGRQSKYIKGIWLKKSISENIRTDLWRVMSSDLPIPAMLAHTDWKRGTTARLTVQTAESNGYLTDGGTLEQTTIPAVNGNNIVTTLDINVQRIIEKHIREFNEAIGSKNTAVIVQAV